MFLFLSFFVFVCVCAASSSAVGVDAYLGLLYPTDSLQVFGYLSNTNVKFVVVADDADIKDVDVKSVSFFFFLINFNFIFALFFGRYCFNMLKNECFFVFSFYRVSMFFYDFKRIFFSTLVCFLELFFCYCLHFNFSL